MTEPQEDEPWVANPQDMLVAEGDVHVFWAEQAPRFRIQTGALSMDGQDAGVLLLGMDRDRAQALMQMLQAALAWENKESPG